MDRTTAPNYATVGGLRLFQDLNLAANQRGTGLVAADRTALQEELVHGLIEATGIVPNAAVLTQAGQAVKRLAGANVTTIAAGGTTALTADNAGIVLVNAAAGAITIDLAAVAGANGVPLRFRFIRTDTSANTVSIAAAGTDVFVSTAWGTISAPVLSNGAPLDVMGDGVSHWIVHAAAQNPSYSITQAQSTTTASNSTYTLISQSVTFPSASRTGGFIVEGHGLVDGNSTAAMEQNFYLTLTDGTVTRGGASFIIYTDANVWFGVESWFNMGTVYAPGSTVTFTLEVGTLGGGGKAGQMAMSTSHLDLIVRDA